MQEDKKQKSIIKKNYSMEISYIGLTLLKKF